MTKEKSLSEFLSEKLDANKLKKAIASSSAVGAREYIFAIFLYKYLSLQIKKAFSGNRLKSFSDISKKEVTKKEEMEIVNYANALVGFFIKFENLFDNISKKTTKTVTYSALEKIFNDVVEVSTEFYKGLFCKILDKLKSHREDNETPAIFAHTNDVMTVVNEVYEEYSSKENSGENDQFWGDFFEVLNSKIKDLTIKDEAAWEWHTPPNISILISKIAADLKSTSLGPFLLYDPFCGSGQLLVNTFKLMKETSSMHKFKFYGEAGSEGDYSTGNLCKINVLANGINANNIQVNEGNPVIKLTFPTNKKFDIVVSNISGFYSEWENSHISNKNVLELIQKDARFAPIKSCPFGNKQFDWLIVFHALFASKKNGAIVLLLPAKMLSRVGSVDVKTREWLLSSNLIEAIIYLPSIEQGDKYFNRVIVVFNKSKSHENVLFVNATDIKKQTRADLSNKEVSTIFDLYKNSQKNNPNVKLVSRTEITTTNYILSFREIFNVPVFEEEPQIDIEIEEIHSQIRQKMKETKALERKINKLLGIKKWTWWIW